MKNRADQAVPLFKDVRKRARGKELSLKSLEELASHYQVSLQAIFVRLARLRVWRAELWMWRKMTNGTFAAKRAWGTKENISYKWYDEEIPNRAFASQDNSTAVGHSFWVSEAPTGLRFRPVSYETKRRGDEVIVLVILKRTKLKESAPASRSGTSYSLFPLLGLDLPAKRHHVPRKALCAS